MKFSVSFSQAQKVFPAANAARLTPAHFDNDGRGRGEVQECDRGRVAERRGHGKQVVSKTIEAHTARSAFIYSVWAVSHASLTAL